MNGIATILRGDARNLPLPDASVDLIITSPPYYQLRAYTDGGEVYDGQIGAEATPREYIAALLDCTREWARVLKPSGSMFVNLGDRYSTGNSGQSGLAALGERYAGGGHSDVKAKARSGPVAGMQQKTLLDLPARYRIGCVDQLGLINRAVMIWKKTNPMPSSAKDRVAPVHEDWVHLTRSPHYFAAVDRIREESTPQKGLAGTFKRPKSSHTLVPGQSAKQQRDDRPDAPAYHPLGRLPGSVWDIATEPLIVPEHVAHRRCCGGVPREGCEDGLTHYAAFPTEWPRRLIQGWAPSGICTACGEGRRPVVDNGPPRGDFNGDRRDARAGRSSNGVDRNRLYRERVAAGIGPAITGEACACPDTTAPTRPAIVLDPFSGTGTTVLVASVLGRHGVGVEMSADYNRLAQWRTTDPGQMAKAARVPAPPKQFEGQGDLFAGLEVVA